MDATPLNTTMIFKIKIQLLNFIYIKHDKLQLTKNEVDKRTIKIVDFPPKNQREHKKLSTDRGSVMFYPSFITFWII